MDQPYIGSIIIFAGNFEINGWAFCDGRLLSIAQNSALFAILGTTYGGNGTSTFALPDLRGRVPLDWGQGPGLSPYALGEVGGVENVALNSNNLPVHTHTVHASSAAAGRGTAPTSGLLATPANSAEIYNTGTPNVTMSPAMIGPAGGNIPVAVLQPFLALNYIIALVGIFPSRA